MSESCAILVTSYDNLDYLRQCLTSLWAKTDHPDFAVTVIDNASGEPVRQYLQAAARREPRLRLIFNSTNLGFARAVNLGLSAAGSCDYVVLLNDDTIVTPDWLNPLLHHLQDPAIGLVGPVTNWAGNQARIPITYRDIDGLDRFAEGWTRPRAGRVFDIPVAALFCAAIRRPLLDQIGGLDERFEIGMFEDDDLALRVRQAGFRVVCAEDVFIHHWGRASFSRLAPHQYAKIFAENRSRYEAKWGVEWQPHRPRPTGFHKFRQALARLVRR